MGMVVGQGFVQLEQICPVSECLGRLEAHHDHVLRCLLSVGGAAVCGTVAALSTDACLCLHGFRSKE